MFGAALRPRRSVSKSVCLLEKNQGWEGLGGLKKRAPVKEVKCRNEIEPIRTAKKCPSFDKGSVVDK